jgi:hypothetical protein
VPLDGARHAGAPPLHRGRADTHRPERRGGRPRRATGIRLFDYDDFNAEEQVRLAGIPPEKLLSNLADAREATITWVATLDDAELDRMGYHPALGKVTLEALINAIHGHQLMHMRDLQALSRS